MSETNKSGYYDYQEPYYRKPTHNKRRKKSKVPIVITVILISIVIIIGVCVCYFLLKKNPLEGRWVYDSYTQYVFEKDGNGCLEVDDVHYEYTYKINGNTLTLDFVEDIVRDCEYTFSVEDSQLTLIGGENTDGGTYKLNKK